MEQREVITAWIQLGKTQKQTMKMHNDKNNVSNSDSQMIVSK